MITLQLKHGLIAQDPEIGRGGIEKKLLLGALQLGASGKYLFFRGLGFSYRTESAKQGLRHLHAEAARPVVEAGILKRGKVRRILVGLADRSVRINAGTPVAQRLRYLLVGRAQLGALRLKRWIVPVGLRPCLLQGLRFGAG